MLDFFLSDESKQTQQRAVHIIAYSLIFIIFISVFLLTSVRNEDTISLVIKIIIYSLALIICLWRVPKIVRGMHDNYRFEIDDDCITRYLKNLKPLCITKNEITKVVLTKKGSLLIKTKSAMKTIQIPAGLINFEEAKSIIISYGVPISQK